jgi:hypothetical protein
VSILGLVVNFYTPLRGVSLTERAGGA